MVLIKKQFKLKFIRGCPENDNEATSAYPAASLLGFWYMQPTETLTAYSESPNIFKTLFTFAIKSFSKRFFTLCVPDATSIAAQIPIQTHFLFIGFLA